MPDEDAVFAPAHFAPGGPVDTVQSFMAAAIGQRSYERCWELMDDNLRLCRAQAWLWNNRSHPQIGSDLDELAAELVSGPGSDLWEAFAEVELDQLVEHWAESYARDLGAASHPRPIGVDLELVLLLPTDGEVLMFDEATLVDDVLPFVVRRVGGSWAVAAYGDFVPVPGWPPQFQPPMDPG